MFTQDMGGGDFTIIIAAIFFIVFFLIKKVFGEKKGQDIVNSIGGYIAASIVIIPLGALFIVAIVSIFK
jgi:hypothetical protein